VFLYIKNYNLDIKINQQIDNFNYLLEPINNNKDITNEYTHNQDKNNQNKQQGKNKSI